MIPSIVCLLVPVSVATFLPAFKGNITYKHDKIQESVNKSGSTILYLGLASIIFVPVFKTITHLPPYVGMMFSLALVSTFAEILSSTKINITSFDDESDDAANHSPVHKSLTKIELPSILFFLGILLSVGALESIGVLFSFADTLNLIFPNTDIVVVLLGSASAIIDNVPLVAASMGMFSQEINNPLWHFIAFSAGTGGSMLIIGSAAGVVAMGMEKIDFFWYFKKISWLALIGFLSGAITFIMLRDFLY